MWVDTSVCCCHIARVPRSPHSLTPAEAATALDVSPRTLARWRASGTGPAFRRAGRRYLYPAEAVRCWLDRLRPGSMPTLDWDAFHATRAANGHVLDWPDEEVVREVYTWRRSDIVDAIDVQCGAGRHTQIMAQIGITAVGVDISAVALDQARRRRGADIRFLIGDARELPVPGGSVGAALCWRSLHVFSASDAVLVLAELARVLRPGGRLLLSTRSGRNTYRERPDVLPRETDREDLYRLVQDAGFAHIEIDLSERTYGGGRYRDSWWVVRAVRP